MDAVERFIVTMSPDGENVVLALLALAIVVLARQVRGILYDRNFYLIEKQELQLQRDALASEEYFKRQDLEIRKTREITDDYLRRQAVREETQGELYLAWPPVENRRPPFRKMRNSRRAEQAPPGQA